MPILNYTTEVAASKSIAEIMRILQDAGASAIMMENGPDREVSAIKFLMDTTFGRIPFTLPANAPAVLVTLNAQIRAESAKGGKRKIPKNLFGDKTQAERIAWRIAKDWLEAQIALVQIGAAKMEQIMLPFATVNGTTFYQHLIERGTLALPAPKNPDAEGCTDV